MTIPQPNRAAPAKNIIFPILFSALLGILLCLLLLAGFSWLICRIDLPLYAAGPLGTLAVSGGIFLTGMTLAKSLKRSGLFIGALSGCAFFLILTAVAVLAGQQTITLFSAIKLICFISSGGIGGVLGILLSEHRKAY